MLPTDGRQGSPGVYHHHGKHGLAKIGFPTFFTPKRIPPFTPSCRVGLESLTSLTNPSLVQEVIFYH